MAVLFDDVDVAIVVQRRLEGTEPPETPPMPYVIRKANEKSVEAIHAEIRAAQARTLARGEQTIDLAEKMPSPRMIRFFTRMPFSVRKAVYWNRLFRDPFRAKRTKGPVRVTSVGMFGKISGGSSDRFSTKAKIRFNRNERQRVNEGRLPHVVSADEYVQTRECD